MHLYLDLSEEFGKGQLCHLLSVALVLMLVQGLLFMVPTEFPQTLNGIWNQYAWSAPLHFPPLSYLAASHPVVNYQGLLTYIVGSEFTVMHRIKTVPLDAAQLVNTYWTLPPYWNSMVSVPIICTMLGTWKRHVMWISFITQVLFPIKSYKAKLNILPWVKVLANW